MEALVESCNNDIRWVLNTLQMRRKASTKLSYDEVAKQGANPQYEAHCPMVAETSTLVKKQ